MIPIYHALISDADYKRNILPFNDFECLYNPSLRLTWSHTLPFVIKRNRTNKNVTVLFMSSNHKKSLMGNIKSGITSFLWAEKNYSFPANVPLVMLYTNTVIGMNQRIYGWDKQLRESNRFLILSVEKGSEKVREFHYLSRANKELYPIVLAQLLSEFILREGSEQFAKDILLALSSKVYKQRPAYLSVGGGGMYRYKFDELLIDN